MSVYIREITRPRTKVARTSADDPIEYEDGNALRLLLDLEGDWQRTTVAVLPFADYTGLEAEFETGTATTVLEAAIQTWFTTYGFPPDHLSSAQRSKVGDDLQVA